MRVLLANKFFFNNGGSESVMFQEREFLRSVGVDVVDFSMRDPRNLPSPYAEFFVAPQTYGGLTGAAARVGAALRLIHSPEAVRKIGRLIDRTRPDLVHCHNIYHQLTPSIIGAARRRGVPVVLTLHDYKPVCPVYTRLRGGRVCSECIDGGVSGVLRHRCADGSLARSALLYGEALVQRWRKSYERVSVFVAPSEFMRVSVAGRLPAGSVQVLHNGVDTTARRPSFRDEGYALYLGRLSPEKGVETLLAAHAGLAGRVPLRIAGTGPLEAELRARHPAAHWLGHLSGEELARTLAGASLVVVPSEWYENCPMSVLEAMACGKPVVASAIGGIPELVADGVTGLLFPPGDRDALAERLARLMGDPALRRSQGAAARERAEQRFSLARHNTALLRLYLGVVEDARGSDPGRARSIPATNEE